MSKKILVVDDDQATLHLLEKILNSNGYEVFKAVDGLDALVKVKNEKPDLILLDIMMPEINGYDVCYQLRFNQEFDQIPIVLLTVRDRELDKETSERVNIDYVPKPIDTEVILEKVKTLLVDKE